MNERRSEVASQTVVVSSANAEADSAAGNGERAVNAVVRQPERPRAVSVEPVRAFLGALVLVWLAGVLYWHGAAGVAGGVSSAD